MFSFNKNIDFIKYWLALSISAIGDVIRRITLTLWVFAVSGESGLAIALLALVEIIPQLALAPFTGVLIDRWDRRKILVASNSFRALFSISLIIAVVSTNLALAYLFISISSILAAFSGIAQDSIIPTLVVNKHLQAANSAILIGRQLAFVLGPIIAVYFYTSHGPESSFLFDAATFLVAGILFYFIPITSSNNPNKSQKLTYIDFVNSFVSGLNYLRSTSIVRASMIATLLISLGSGINSTVMIFFITQNLGRQAADIAWLSVANGVTQILIGGYILLRARKTALKDLLLLSLFIMSVGGIVIASSTALHILIIGVLAVSLGNSPFNIAQTTLVQKYTNPHILGRVEGFKFSIGTIAFLLSSTIAGIFLGVLQPRTLLWVSTILTVLTGVYTLVVLTPILSRRHKS